jgi:hypothetical protein
MDKSIEERRGDLEELISTMESKTQAMETILKSFSNLVEDSLEQAEAKARQAGAVLAENASTTAQAIAEQFELIRATTGKERDRTSSAMRAAYEQAVSEVTSLFGSAVERFTEVTQDMRGMARAIQQELETTRVELKRGLMEIPKETSESTATMRRVVAEQIQALNDLSEIVTRAGRSLDIVEPARQNAAGRGENAAVASGGASVRQAGGETARSRPEPSKPAQAAVRPALPSATLPTASERRGGWLSDLLARASRDESEGAEESAPENALPTPSSLDTLSSDISKLVEHDAADELWDRYRKGERNIFSRRLYTLQGQQTFEEIRRRYRRDAEFRATVDRYVQEFERLIADVDREDRSGSMAKTYLTAESGKVYTILAHAAGKIG